MKLKVFNAALLLGVAMLGVGIGLEFGVGFGLASAGALVTGLTIYFARAAGVKA